MSWDPFAQGVVAQGTFDKVIVVDSTGQTTWGKGGPIEIAPEEINTIVTAFKDPTEAQQGGIKVDGVKYVFIGVNDITDIPIMHCPLGKEGIVAAQCNKAVFIAHHPDTTPAPKAIDSAVTQALHINKYT